MTLLPFADPAGAASSAIIAMASERFQALSNGRPESIEDLIALLVLAAQTEEEKDPNPRIVGAKVQLHKLGLGYKLTLSDQERLGLYLLASWRLTAERQRSVERLINDKGGNPRELTRALWQRSCSVWDRVQTSRSDLAESCARLAEELEPLLPKGLTLMPHQLEGVLAARRSNFRFLFADDMGLGKTIEILACTLLMGERAFPMLVACPLSMVHKWTMEAKKWLAKLDLVTCKLTNKVDTRQVMADARASGQQLLMAGSWQAPVYHQAIFERHPMGLVVGDESHYISNWDSGRTQAFLRSRRRAQGILLASGTMMENGRHREAYSQLKALDPKALSFLKRPNEAGRVPRGDRFPFLYRYCGPTSRFVGKFDNDGNPKSVTRFDGRSHEVEFGCLLNRHRIRRTKAEVFGATELPPKARFVVPVPISDRQRLKFAQTRDQICKIVRELAEKEERRLSDHGVNQDVIAEKVKKICQTESVRLISALRSEIGLVKAQWSKVRIHELLAEGHRPVVFCWHKRVAELAAEVYAKKGVNVLLGTGGMVGRKRERVIEAAERGTHDVVVLTSAYREGITLTAYNWVVMLERWWKPGQERQAEDRVHRIGQTRACGADYLVIPNSYDEAIGKLQIWKEQGQVQSEGTAEERVYEWLMVA